jgi:hypothetical protein
MADFEFTKVTAKDLFKGVELEVYAPYVQKRYRVYVSRGDENSLQVAFTIANRTATEKDAYVQLSTDFTILFKKKYTVAGGGYASDYVDIKNAAIKALGKGFPYALTIEVRSNGAPYQYLSVTVYDVWWLETHAFMYGSEPDGLNLDGKTTINVSGQIESISPYLHAFSNLATAKVENKPYYPGEHGYWIIGKPPENLVRQTENPASFTMTYHNYAYAYICFPAPRWLALEDIDLDRRISIYDVVRACSAYLSRPGDPNWDPLSDIDGDGRVSIYDIVLITCSYGYRDEDLPPPAITVTAPTLAATQSMTASAISLATAASAMVIFSAFLKAIVRSLRR